MVDEVKSEQKPVRNTSSTFSYKKLADLKVKNLHMLMQRGRHDTDSQSQTSDASSVQGSVKSDLTGMANPTIKYKHLLKKKCK